MIAWAIERRARRMRQKWIVAQGLNATEVCRAGSRDDPERERERATRADDREDDRIVDAADYLLSPV